ncbi:glutamine amidotransferase [Streptomyces iranensis]|uniref:GMP synthase (Glutamine-hydrolyzing) n=1 Tax=Streptomyces iranensis TaxID=576784 RepID=A0A060ZBU0_9ACTN|nr:glutamine amidotransferase [Streptomyces iranensis]MBP2063343.1 GMP synthase (glutamine-hydrolyzing) [Streptomyces iranensis]CDR01722.1 Methyltransferase type 11 [Streptomyces iranensis]
MPTDIADTSPSRTALVIQHLGFEDLGLLEPLLHERGYLTRYLDVATQPVDTAPVRAAELVVVLGGPVGANDADRYPFLADELAALRTRLADGSATLGICLGAQLLARALGAQVTPGAAREIGYAPVRLTPEGAASPLRHLAGVPVLHWHNDMFGIPENAQLLADTPTCPHQAFALGTQILALQFHLETPAQDIERWLVGHAEALAAADIHPAELRRSASEAAPELHTRAIATITEWLTAAGC